MYNDIEYNAVQIGSGPNQAAGADQTAYNVEDPHSQKCP